jgi:hypothetical protein
MPRECTCALLLGVLVLALLRDARPTAAANATACLVSATRVVGCRTCARVRVNATVNSTVCTGCSTGYAFKRSGSSPGVLCGERIGSVYSGMMPIHGCGALIRTDQHHASRVCCWIWEHGCGTRAKEHPRPQLEAAV